MKNAYNVLFGKPEERRPLERPSHRWEENIRMALREIGVKKLCTGASGSGLGPVVGCCKH